MNQTSLEKIQAATSFLQWFRYYLPTSMQHQLRPYLDQPYQLALKILDACDAEEGSLLKTIALTAAVSQNTARQVLNVMRDDQIILVRESRQGLIFQTILPEGAAAGVIGASSQPAAQVKNLRPGFSSPSELSAFGS